MKKFFKVLMIMILVAFPFVSVNAKTTKKAAKEPINFYIFYGKSCGFCQKLHNYTATLENDKTINSKFRIVDYEVWYDENNSELMTKVGNYFDFDVDGVPFYVIGDQYFTGFNEETSPEKIVKAINEEYSASDYVDVVAGIQDGSITVTDSNNTGKVYNENKKKNDVVGYIILGITAAIVIAILFGRSSTGQYVATETEEEKVEESKKEEKKTTEKEEKAVEENKKTTTKKTTTKKNTKKSKK